MGGSVFRRSETTGGFLLDLGHADVPFRPVVGKADFGVLREAQDFGLVAGEGLMQVLGI